MKYMALELHRQIKCLSLCYCSFFFFFSLYWALDFLDLYSSVSMNLFILDVLCKWNSAFCVWLLWLSSAFKVHISFVFIAESCSIEWIYHILKKGLFTELFERAEIGRDIFCPQAYFPDGNSCWSGQGWSQELGTPTILIFYLEGRSLSTWAICCFSGARYQEADWKWSWIGSWTRNHMGCQHCQKQNKTKSSSHGNDPSTTFSFYICQLTWSHFVTTKNYAAPKHVLYKGVFMFPLLYKLNSEIAGWCSNSLFSFFF